MTDDEINARLELLAKAHADMSKKLSMAIAANTADLGKQLVAIAQSLKGVNERVVTQIDQGADVRRMAIETTYCMQALLSAIARQGSTARPRRGRSGWRRCRTRLSRPALSGAPRGHARGYFIMRGQFRPSVFAPGPGHQSVPDYGCMDLYVSGFSEVVNRPGIPGDSKL